MNRHHLLAGLAPLAGALLLATTTAPADAVPLPPAYGHQPVTGVAIHCDRLGVLTGASGYFVVAEPVVDVHGHGYVYFTATTHRVRLTGTDGTTYQLLGTGYDSVVRSTLDGHSPILAEHERYHFDVVDADGVVGEIRYAMHQGADGVVHTHDGGDCHLPKGDE